MNIARVTVVDGKAHVVIDGLDVPVIVTEGQSLSLDMRPNDQGFSQTISMEWVEMGEERSLVIAATNQPG